MATLAVLMHDGFYGCGTGAGLSNRRFLEVAVSLISPECRLVVLPVRVSRSSAEYDAPWHAASLDLVAKAGGEVQPLENGSDGTVRFGSLHNWQRLGMEAATALRSIVTADRAASLIVAFDVPFLGLAGQLQSTARLVPVPRGTLALHAADAPSLQWEAHCYRRAVDRGALVGAISTFMADHVVSTYAVPRASIIDLHDGTTGSEWSERCDPIELPEPARGGFMLAMGRAQPYKGFDDMLDALALLGGTDVPHTVLAAVTEERGMSAYQRHLRRRIGAERLDVTLVMRFSPRVRALIGHPRLRAVIVPSRVEPFGRIPMEVFAHPGASAVAVVASTAGGLPEVAIADETAFSFEAGSSAALASSLRRALESSPEHRARLHSAGRRLVAARHSYPVNVASFVRILAPWALSEVVGYHSSSAVRRPVG